MQSYKAMTDADLIEKLRRAASIWFKDTDLLLLEELIRRFHAHTRQTHSEPRD
jgi:hypothetical protein